MTHCPFDHFGMHKQELVDKLTAVGIETQTSRCEGGHSMPKKEDPSYTLLAKFYAGTPTTEVPGAPRPKKDWSLAQRQADDRYRLEDGTIKDITI